MNKKDLLIKQIGWKAEGVESGTKFDVDLSEKVLIIAKYINKYSSIYDKQEWADYDEKSKCSVGIYDFHQKFEKA